MSSSSANSISNGKYILLKTIGSGAFGKVRLANDTSSGRQVAIKELDRDHVAALGAKKHLQKELQIMATINHPNLPKFYEIIAEGKLIYIVMEYLPKSLYDIVSGGSLDEETARSYFQQLLSALEYCHTKGIYHRDLKLDNIMFDANGTLKVIDFGFGCIRQLQPGKTVAQYTVCGSPAFAAPEVQKPGGYDPCKADIWSVGVILYSMIFGKLPFEGNDPLTVLGKACNAEYSFSRQCSSEVRDLISKILVPCIPRRYSLKSIKSHPFFVGKAFSQCPCYFPSDLKIAILPDDLNVLTAFEVFSLHNPWNAQISELRTYQ